MSSFTALVLDDDSRNLLISSLSDLIPEGWEVLGHHMTINMGGPEKGPADGMLGFHGVLKVTHIDMDNRVLAIAVETEIPSKNARKHVTVGVNREGGGKPVHSNELDFPKVIPIAESYRLRGTVQHVRKETV